MICNTSPYQNFCAQSSCLPFSLGIPAQGAGDYILIINWKGVEYRITQTFLDGADLSFPLDGVPETAEMLAIVLNPAGDPVEFVQDDNTYTAFILKTNLTYSL